MPAGFAGAWFVHHLLKGRSARQIESGFWLVVLVLATIFGLAFIAQVLFPAAPLPGPALVQPFVSYWPRAVAGAV